MRIYLNGESWELRFRKTVRNDQDILDGLCIHDERRIVIQSGQEPEDELETILHELLHASDPRASEETVTEQAREHAEVLWKLGYRRS